MASRRRPVVEKIRSVSLEAIPRIQPSELTYEGGGEVERGSFGDVKKAKWRGRDVAVKLFIVADKKGGISEEVRVRACVCERACASVRVLYLKRDNRWVIWGSDNGNEGNYDG